MGSRMVVPEADAKLTFLLKHFHMSKNDVNKFWKLFQSLDKAKTGLINLEQMWKSIEMQRNIVTDGILEILEIQHDGEINFGDFISMVITFCMFEVNDIVRFCFYLFDQDKTGFFLVDDLKTLMNSLHNVQAPNKVKGNQKQSWKLMEFREDNKIEFHDYAMLTKRFPQVFAPVFRLQQEMKRGFFGVNWWEAKKFEIERFKEKADAIIAKKEAKKKMKEDDIKAKKVKKKMGLAFYFCCPCCRVYYDPSREDELLTADERAARDKRLADARRAAELRVKNPETAEWQNFQAKIDPLKGGSEEYFIEKLEKTETARVERKLSRAERKAAREADPDLSVQVKATGDI
jgi:Ca2+-binding EF-hand superfamily protein